MNYSARLIHKWFRGLALVSVFTISMAPLGAMEIAEPPATRVWDLGALRLETPVSYLPGKPFHLEIELLEKHGEPESLEISFNYLKKDGSFAGRLHNPDDHKIFSDVGNWQTTVTLPENPEDLGVALLTIHLSPDRSWEKRSMSLAVPLLPDGGSPQLYAAQAEKAVREGVIRPMDIERTLEDYTSRTEYFSQRNDDPSGRDWILQSPNYPDLESVLASTPITAPYGVYCWSNEFAAAHEEIIRMGIRAVRLGGPWGDAMEAMELAAKNGVEVFFTLMTGKDLETYRASRRPNFENDEAFVEAFANDVVAFLEIYGPGGTFEAETGLPTPLVAVGIWNEPNFQYMIPNTGDQASDEIAREALYPLILKAGARAVRNHVTGIKVVGFSSGGADFADQRFLRNIHRKHHGIVDAYDILATHPYNKGAPPEAHKNNFWGQYSIADGRAVIRGLYQDLDTDQKPVWYTELGWAVAKKHGGRFPATANRIRNIVTPDLQAAYVVRAWILALRLQVERIFVMNLHDTDGFNAGFIVRHTHEWRPVAQATRNLTGLLPRPQLRKALHDGVEGLYAYQIRSDLRDSLSHDIWVAWNVGDPREIEIPWSNENAEIIDLVGNRKMQSTVEGKLRITVGPYPIYIR